MVKTFSSFSTPGLNSIPLFQPDLCGLSTPPCWIFSEPSILLPIYLWLWIKSYSAWLSPSALISYPYWAVQLPEDASAISLLFQSQHDTRCWAHGQYRLNEAEGIHRRLFRCLFFFVLFLFLKAILHICELTVSAPHQSEPKRNPDIVE